VLRYPWLFVPLRLVDGGGSSALWPAASAIIADATPPQRRATAMGTLNMFFLAGLAFGPALALFVVGATGAYTSGFYLASVVLLGDALLAAVTLRDLGATRRRPPNGVEIGYHVVAPTPPLDEVVAHARRSPLLLVMLVVAFVQMFGAGLLAPILVIYAKQVVRLPEHLIGTLFLVLMLAVALASVPAGRLADSRGKLRTVAWGMGVGSVGMWLLPLSPRLETLAAGAILLGISYALSTPAWHATVSELAPPGRIGTVMGASQTAQGLGLVLGPTAGGLLWDTLGVRAPFLGAAALLTAATALLLLALRWFGSPARSAPR